MILGLPQNMWIKSSILVFLITTLFATQSLGQSSIPTEPTYFTEVCGSLYGNYTASSSYSTNLKTVLSTLQEQSSNSLFYNSTAGQVHAQYYCRFDADSALCSACISLASDTILTNCPNYKSAVIWYDVCTLRYHNDSMLGVLSTSRVGYSWSTANVSDPDSFEVILNSTLGTLIKQSAYGNDFRMFAVGDVAVSTFETTYFLVQCSPDLSAVECDTCLWDTYAYINRCCGNWPIRARVYFPSCQMRYSNTLFYTAPASASPPPPPLLLTSPPPPADVFSPPPPSTDILAPPPLVSTTSPTDGTTKASSEKLNVGLAAVFLAFFMLQL